MSFCPADDRQVALDVCYAEWDLKDSKEFSVSLTSDLSLISGQFRDFWWNQICSDCEMPHEPAIRRSVGSNVVR